MFPFQILAQAVQSTTATNYNPLGTLEVIAWVYLGLLFFGALVNLALLVQGLLAPVKWSGTIAIIKQRAWPTTEIGRLFLLLLLLHAFGALFYGMIPGTEEPGNPYEVIGIFIQSLAFQWAGLALIIASLCRRHITWSQAFGVQVKRILKDVGKGVLYYLAAVPFLLVASLVWSLLLKYFGIEAELQDIMLLVTDDFSPGVRVYLLIMAVVLAPVFEEVLFRGIALTYLVRQIKTIPALLVVSALFSLIHFHLPSAVPLFVIAMAFGLAYLRTGSIVVPITMHMIFNGINVILMFAMRNGQ